MSVSTQKRLMVVLFLCIISFLALTLVTDNSDAAVDEKFTIDGIEYTVTAEGTVNEVEITECVNKSITTFESTGTVVHNSKTYTIRSIENRAFFQCKSLISVTIPDSVLVLKGYAFAHCTGLKELKFPISINSIYSGNTPAFIGCVNIEKITFSVGNGDGYDYWESNGNRTAQYYIYTPMYISTHLTTVVFENGIKSIGDYTLCRCNHVVSITLPESITSIGEHAFFKCKSLTSLVLPENLKSIGDGALGFCESLSSVSIPKNIKSINRDLFYNCTSLTSMVIPENVTYLGNNAFEGCTGLRELTIPINLDAASIAGSGVWNGCENIEKVTFTPGNGVGIDYGTAIRYKGHNNERLPWIISKDSLTTVNFEKGITHIGSFIMHKCPKLASISIPDTVTSIGKFAFYECQSLADIDLPDSVKDIGKDAFTGCPGYSSLKSFDFNEIETLNSSQGSVTEIRSVENVSVRSKA